MIPGGMPFNAQLHPRAAGGKFAAKGTGTASQQQAARRQQPRRGTARRRSGTAVPPNGLGYSAKQWAQLRQWAAMARAGKRLDRHQLHMLHQAHQRRLAAMTRASAPKPRRKPAARKAAVKRTTVTRMSPRKATAARKPAGRRISPAQVQALRNAGYR